VYYTLADIVLLAQCFYYKGFVFTDEVVKSPTNGYVENGSSNEQTPLLRNDDTPQNRIVSPNPLAQLDQRERRFSGSSLRERLMSLEGAHFSPATPLHPDSKPRDQPREPVARTSLQSVLFNSVVILLVCLSGIVGWWLSNRQSRSKQDGQPDLPEEPEVISFNILGQIFGYVCAVLYLGSRIPQLLLNYRRKSTEGISMLFFLFACIGNLTYVMSIFAYSPQAACAVPGECEPGEAGRMYGRYIAVNLSWIVGSFGTLLLDAGVFVQYFLYQKNEESDDMSAEEAIADDAPEASVSVTVTPGLSRTILMRN
jgi:hypothetical protein